MKARFFCLIILHFFILSLVAAVEVQGVYFTETGCSHCDAFLYAGKARLEKQYGITLVLETHDILSQEGYALCMEMLAQRDMEFTVFPVLFIGMNVYRGSSAIETFLPEELEFYLAKGRWRDPLPDVLELAPTGFSLAFLPVLFAGLLDGLNPCAFSTMLFFLSFIGLRRNNRKEVLSAGLSFIVGVFIAYFIIGLGFLGAFRTFLSRGRFSLYLNILVSILAALMVVLNLRDAYMTYRGKGADSVLQLSPILKRTGHGIIRRFSTLPALGSALAGVLVSFIELACTGQIYLPTLVYMNQASLSSRSILLLSLYNIAFVFPLMVVFMFFILGMKHLYLRQWYGRHILTVRLVSALFFIVLGTSVWIL